MTSLYERLIALLTADPAIKWPHIVQWHTSVRREVESGAEPTWQVVPKTDEIYLVYSQTMGWPVDADGTQIDPTTDVGFHHWQEPNLRKNTNYAIGSIINHPEECWIEVEEGSPLEFKFFNDLDPTVYIDITVWIFVVKKGEWELVREYLMRPLLEKGEE